MANLSFEEVSFVVQGAINSGANRNTKDVLRSIRQNFPGAVIILSTWPKQNLSGLEYDLLIVSDDPGDDTPKGYKPSNLNRQLVSTKAGLSRVETKYCVKTRTDIEFYKSSLFDYFGLFDDPKEDTSYRLFKNRLVALNTTSFCLRKGVPIPFSICDFLYAGNTEDVRALFDVDLCPKDEFSYFLTHSKPKPDPFPRFVAKNSPETYIWKSIVRKNFELEDSCLYDANDYMKLLSERILVCNIVLCNSKQLGVRSIKYTLPFNSLPYLYLHKDWLKLYCSYVREIEIPLWDLEYPELMKYLAREKIKALLDKLGILDQIRNHFRSYSE